MAKVSSPLFGSSAAGVFGGLLAFRSKPGLSFLGCRPRARVFTSPEALGQQVFYKSACVQWGSLSVSEKAAFFKAAPVGLSGFQFFLSSAAASNLSLGVSAPVISPWFPCFSSVNVGLLSGFCYLLPGFESGFIVFLPVPLDDLVRVRSVQFEALPVVSEGCTFSAYFAVSDSVFFCPDVENFYLLSASALLSFLGVGSSGSGRVLWIRCGFSQVV